MGILAVTAGLLIVFNVAMWIFFMKKFNAFFSTDEIIDETNLRVQEIVRDMNYSTERDIRLAEESVKRLKAVTAEAERKIAVLKKDLALAKELSLAEKTREFQTKIENLSQKKLFPRENIFLKEGSQLSLSKEEPTVSTASKQDLTATGNPSSSQNSDSALEVFVAENPISTKKDFLSEVAQLQSLGFSDDEIAYKTGRNVQEVKLAIGLS